MAKYFVTGIGTDVGKTLVSAILVEAMQADYWKPVQAGDLENSDTLKVKNLISNTVSKFHKESYALTSPMSPHAAAEIDGVTLDLSQIQMPETSDNLIIEGAGGIMVPLNQKDLIIDLIKKLNVEVILVSQNYLGSINHTILSIEALNSRGIAIKGIIFNGPENKETEEFVLNYAKLVCLGRIQQHQCLDKDVIQSYKDKFCNL